MWIFVKDVLLDLLSSTSLSGAEAVDQRERVLAQACTGSWVPSGTLTAKGKHFKPPKNIYPGNGSTFHES